MGVTDVFDDIKFYFPKGEKLHTTQKPIELMNRIVECCSNNGDLILDPFMGSASTAISCKILNRNYIGCELDDNYYKICLERLEIK